MRHVLVTSRSVLLVMAVAFAGCSKKPVPGSGSGSSRPESTASPELLQALDLYDRWLAPIWKLEPGPRFTALCAAVNPLRDQALALRGLAPPPGVKPEVWTEAVEGMYASTGPIGLCCDQLSKDTDPVQDANNAECIAGVHARFAAVVALVTGAKPIDTHASDPLMTPPAAPSVDPRPLQQTTMFAHTTLSAVAVTNANTANELCAASHTGVKAVAAMFHSPDLAIPASIEKQFRDELSGLMTSLASFDEHDCGPGKHAALATIKDSLRALTERTKKLVMIAANAK
jgi:hypothetical protein